MSGVVSVGDRLIESKGLPGIVVVSCSSITSVSEQMLKSTAYPGGR